MPKHSPDQEQNNFQIIPIGYLHRIGSRAYIEILPEFIPALKELEGFSHVQTFWWFNKFEDQHSRQTVQFEKMPFTAPCLGVFACRSPMRPNPIGLSPAKIINVDHHKGIIEIADLDAFDGTPILDLKAYIPSCDRVKNVRVPDWAADWPEWVPESGLGLEA